MFPVSVQKHVATTNEKIERNGYFLYFMRTEDSICMLMNDENHRKVHHDAWTLYGVVREMVMSFLLYILTCHALKYTRL